jgi:hypothetical protein
MVKIMTVDPSLVLPSLDVVFTFNRILKLDPLHRRRESGSDRSADPISNGERDPISLQPIREEAERAPNSK